MSDSVKSHIISPQDLIEYDFGKKRIWPKPELKGFDLLQWQADLQRRLHALPELAKPEHGRSDHYAKGLHTLAYALRDCLFKVIVLQETLYGPQEITRDV